MIRCLLCWCCECKSFWFGREMYCVSALILKHCKVEVCLKNMHTRCCLSNYCLLCLTSPLITMSHHVDRLCVRNCVRKLLWCECMAAFENNLSWSSSARIRTRKRKLSKISILVCLPNVIISLISIWQHTHCIMMKATNCTLKAHPIKQTTQAKY